MAAGLAPAQHHSKMFATCGRKQAALRNPFYSQAGQDQYVYQRFFKVFDNAPLGKSGVFVEVGQKNGLKHSNTAFFEVSLGWKVSHLIIDI